jgi:hypothetical protein
VVVIRGLVLTVSKNVPVLTCKAVSRTVTEKEVAVTRNLVGVPVICPVLPAKFNPNGSTGLIVYDRAPNPPDPSTGINGVTRSYCISVSLGIDCRVIAGGVSTDNVNVLLLVCNAVSVTVTVYEVAVEVAVGVPVILPLIELNVNPVGKLGLIA